MDDDAILRAMLVFGASLLVGPAIDGLVGWRKGFEWGTAIGALLIGVRTGAMRSRCATASRIRRRRWWRTSRTCGAGCGRWGGSAVRRFEFRIIFAIIGLGFWGFGFGAWKMM